MTRVLTRRNTDGTLRRRRALVGMAVGLSLLLGGTTSVAAVVPQPEIENNLVDPALDAVDGDAVAESDATDATTPEDNSGTPVEGTPGGDTAESEEDASESNTDGTSETVEELPPVEKEAPADADAAPLDADVAPTDDGPSFAETNLDRYFSLVIPTEPKIEVNYGKTHIRYLHMNASSDGFLSNQKSPEWLAKDLVLPHGRTPASGRSVQRNPNALGVTEHGIFYFTNQYQQSSQEYVDVWQFDSNAPIVAYPASNPNPRRIVSGMGLGPTIPGDNPQQIVAGAYNSFDDAFYFGLYKSVGQSVTRKIALSIYKASQPEGAPTESSWSAGLIGTAQTAPGVFLAATNGDFDFDSAGNLTFLVSGQGVKAQAFLGTISSNDIQAASTTVPVTFEDFTMSSELVFETGDANGQANGMVFARSGQMVVQASDHQRMLNPNTLKQSTSINPFTQIAGQRTMTTDLASFASPPTVRVDKDVVARIDPLDQFTLRLGNGSTLQAATTNGSAGDPAATGIQDRKLGPVGVYQGDEITIDEIMASSSNKPSDLALYEKQLTCVNESLPESDPNRKLTFTGPDANFAHKFKVPATPAGSWKGPQVVCTITNEGHAPRLSVSKTSDPKTGTPVTERQEVNYTLLFDNSESTGPVTDVDFTDHLKDVLDDADLDPASIKVRDVTDPDRPVDLVAGFFAVFNPALKTIRISGALDGSKTATVPAKKKYTVSYTVTVKPNVDPAGKVRENSKETTAYRMTNFLVTGKNEIPDKCEAPGEDEEPLCSEHQVKAWTVTKDSKPSNGAQLHHGGNVYYNLEVLKNDPGYGLKDIVVTDDLTEVMRAADWDASAPELSGTRTRGIHIMDAAGTVVRTLGESHVPVPVYNGSDKWTLTTAPFDLLPGESGAQVWFAVKVGTPPQVGPDWQPAPPVPGTVFTNRVTAAAGDLEPKANQCQTGVPAGNPGGPVESCEVTHSVGSDYFTVRKDGHGTLENGETMNLQNLIGHEFELRTDDNGSMGGAPGFMCASPNDPPLAGSSESCARFYPIPDGSQAGRWRAERVPAGTYWLLETKAPDAQRVSATVTRPVTGVQLLAEPVRFVVGPDEEFGQLDIFKTGSTAFEDRCDPNNSPENIACVSPTGYLMVVKDPGLLPLPLSGGGGVNLLTLGALLLMGSGLGAGYLWRRNRYAQQPS